MSGMTERALSGAVGEMHAFASRSISSSVLTGLDPTHFDASNPITLFIIQLFIIIVFTQGLGYVFSFLKQPRVIAEVAGGIILGPTVMGRIPNFTAKIFPTQSVSYLNLVANIGLILFLFLVGLEVDVSVMKKNGRNSAIISLAGMVVPFGLGAAAAVPIYNNFVETDRVSFGHFLLFVGVAFAITAFPVLCRILTATNLLETKVGVIVLAAGVGNDVVGWVLLALTLALVNASAGETAVYILLCAVGWAILLLWPIKKGFKWLARRTGSLSGNGPTPSMMVVTLLMVFASAFVTGVIGVHPIFGGFLAGLVIPHEGGFAIALVEKIDDLVSMLFLPIYFVLSGLATNLGLLDTGMIWGYIILVCVLAWAGKFFGCAVTAKVLGYTLRESGAIGMLMSCKGLVELIVLNVGLSAGIIDQRLFSMFVVVALVLTFITTPFTVWIYPERHRTTIRDEAQRGKDSERARAVEVSVGSGGRETTSRFLVVLQKIEHLSAVMFISQMLEPASGPQRRPPPSIFAGINGKGSKVSGKLSSSDDSDESAVSSPAHAHIGLPSVSGEDTATIADSAGPTAAAPAVHMDALKLMELTGRMSSVMQSAEKDQILLGDDTLQLFKQFGRLRGLEVSPHISIVSQDNYPNTVVEHAENLSTELVLLPWTIPVISSSSSEALIDTSASAASSSAAAHGGGNKDGLGIAPVGGSSAHSSLASWENVFGADSQGSPMYTTFLRRVFAECSVDIALFIDRGFGSSSSFTPGAGQHVFLPFFGGADDRLALRLVVQLCQHTNVTATVVRIERSEESISEASQLAAKESNSESVQAHQQALQSNQLTLHPAANDYPGTQHRLASDTADNIAWTYYTASSTTPPRSTVTNSALARISFHSVRTADPLSRAVELADSACHDTHETHDWRPLLVVMGRGRRGAAVQHTAELNRILSEKSQNPTVGAELRKTVGDAATGLMLGGGSSRGASFLVMESGAGKA